MTHPDTGRATTLGELRDSGHVHRSVKSEIRENLLARLRAGDNAFPGMVGFEETVLPELETALLAGHDLVLLGERGQGKTRLMRTLAGLLDEWSPVVEGCEIGDDPHQPSCVRCRRMTAELGEDLPVAWRHRSERYTEKLATPDTSVGDLVGDVDPVKVAQGRTLGDPETVHYGLVPRSNRGIFGLNELPDLAERIQVALFNVPEDLLEVIARFTRGLRESSAVDQRSGVSARFAIAGAEGVAGSALRRAARSGEAYAVARVCDVPTVVPTLLGKVEFEMGEEGREREVLDHLLRVAVAETFRARLGGLDLSGFTGLFAEGAVVETGELVPAAELLGQLGTVPGLSKVLDRLGHGDDASVGETAAAVEFVLEGLHLTRRIDKDTVAGRTVYGA